ncbi:RING finger protein [Taphrina deformans PYCC 5710]|uniref:RING finger protein n=1 Tax=Taphrina deformans (strain PYCC 5710 / ATCC 11124 / CBS 356.35 / IMI 108563 / JCM 9778 / NBRC 8474) TaxID=1097556 RepID=R4XF57_TAPDE|nr:RING finger protein [Taphrina deformans PYCC 5710]|eukprot:CCG83096.1 RING finger protein [Taphrina deformans PYCC 5710]
MFLVFTLITGKALQRIFFGRLRAIEVDHLYERAWYAVTESCLAMTIFREEFGTTFFLFFTLLLSVKIFHWLTQDRIEYMEQTVQVPHSFHIRLTSIMAILLAVDCYMVAYCLEQVFTHGPNVMIMFAFEFTILASTILAVVGKYILNLIEARQTETWDNKSGYVFYLELISDFTKLITYLAFFATLMTFYGIPLHILRDLRATQDMDERYRNATIAEIEATGDKTCIMSTELARKTTDMSDVSALSA